MSRISTGVLLRRMKRTAGVLLALAFAASQGAPEHGNPARSEGRALPDGEADTVPALPGTPPGAMLRVPERVERLASVEWPSQSWSAASPLVQRTQFVGLRGAETAGGVPLPAVPSQASGVNPSGPA